MGFLSGGILTVLVWGAEGGAEGKLPLFLSPHKCGFTQYLREVLFMDKEKLPYFEGVRALEQASRRGCGASFSGHIPTCLDMILCKLL